MGRQAQDVLELIDDRHGAKSLLITSQLPIEHWDEALGDPTLADRDQLSYKLTTGAQDANRVDHDRRNTLMHGHMIRIMEQVEKIRQTKDPKEKDKLIDELADDMANHMKMMQGMMGGGGMMEQRMKMMGSKQ